MRHRVRNAKLGRNGAHRTSLLANLVKSLIKHKRITTTLAKAKAAAPVAEKMITLAKRGSLHDRRLAASRLQYRSRNPYQHKSKEHKEAYKTHYDVIRILFEELGPQFKERNGGYTRIVRLTDKRRGDAGEKAMLMWVSEAFDASAANSESAPAAQEETPAAETEEVIEAVEETPEASAEGEEKKES